jgi:UDP-glucose 4-epimerase
LTNPTGEIGFEDIPYRPDQIMRLEADIERFRNATNWNPKFDLDLGLSETVSWYKENQTGRTMSANSDRTKIR